jgi:hypothetical protein
MPPWYEGRHTIEFLLQRSRLERLAAETATAARGLLEKSEKRLLTARTAAEIGDTEGAFVVSYDAYRIAAESLLLRQGLRATGGDGSHVTVEDATSSQFEHEILSFAKPIFERFRRSRHSAQYFDPSAPEITTEDARWAIETASAAISGTRGLIDSTLLESFE